MGQHTFLKTSGDIQNKYCPKIIFVNTPMLIIFRQYQVNVVLIFKKILPHYLTIIAE